MKKRAEKKTKTTKKTKKSIARPLGGDGMELVVSIDANPIEDGGIKIGVVRVGNNYGATDEKVISGLNVVEAFMVLAGALSDGPKIVGLEMKKVSGALLEHYQRGRDTVQKLQKLRRPVTGKYIWV